MKPVASFCRFYKALTCIGGYLQSPLLLFLRIWWGWGFYVAGSEKFANIARTAEFFGALDIPLPHLASYLVAFVECAGGILLILGLLSRIATLPLIVTMVVALFTAHYEAIAKVWTNYTFAQVVEEPPFFFLLSSLLIFAFGAGALSIDYFLENGKR